MWSFEVFDEKFSEKELTLDDYIELEVLLSVDWRSIHPIRSAKQSKQIAAFMYSKRSGLNFDDALAKVGSLSAIDFLEGLDIIEAEDAEEPAPDPPKAGES